MDNRRMLKIGKTSLWRYIILAVACVPFFVILRILLLYGINSPYYDEWQIVSKYREFKESGFNLLELIAIRCNEHRNPIPVALQMLVWSATDMNDRAVMIASQLVTLMTLGIIVDYISRKQYKQYIILPIAVLLFHLKQVHQFLWASCNMWNLLYFFTFLTFFLFDRALLRSDDRCFSAALCCAVMGTFCAASGLLIWLAILFFCLLCGVFDEKPIEKKYVAITVIITVLVYAVYFFNWGSVSSTTSRVHSIYQFLIVCATASVGAFFEGNHVNAACVVGVILLTGIMGVIFTVCILSKVKRRRLLRENAFPILLAFFFLGSLVMFAFMRGGLLDSQPGVIGLVSQYAHISIGLAVSMCLLLCIPAEVVGDRGKKNFRYLTMLVPVMLFCILLRNSMSKMDICVEPTVMLHQANAFCVQNYLATPEQLKLAYVYPADVTEDVEWMKRERISLFAEQTVYQYPYGDYEEYNVSQPIDGISGGFWQRAESKGLFWIDFINGQAPKSICTVDSSTIFEISGWALDASNNGAPLAVYLKIDENYYPAKGVERADVAEAYFGDRAVTADVGFSARITTGVIPEGDYPMNLIIVYMDGSFYETYLTLLRVQDN